MHLCDGRRSPSVGAACDPAHLWAGAGAVLSHITAAAILGMSPLRPLLIDVTSVRRIKTDGVRVHRTALPRSDVTRSGGFPVTTPTRTLIDLASILDEDRLEDCLEYAVHNRLVRRSKLQTRIAELGRRGRKGAGVLHDLVKLWDPASAPTESELETLLWRVMRKAQMPLPQSQYEVWDGARFIARLDFAYPDALLGIPADSYRWLDVRRQWKKDIEQRNCLLTVGWRLRATTWGELKSRPERFVSDIRVLLDRGAA